jgi:hypothetical protein
MQKDNSPTIAKSIDLAGHTPMMAHHQRNPGLPGLLVATARFGGGLAAISDLHFHGST